MQRNTPSYTISQNRATDITWVKVETCKGTPILALFWTNLTKESNGKVTTSQYKSQTRAKRSALSQQMNTRHQQTDVNEGITRQDQNNIKDLHKKHLLETVSKNILLDGLINQTKLHEVIMNMHHYVWVLLLTFGQHRG